MRVSAIRCTDYVPENVERALTEAVEAVGGLEWVRPGMRIAIKANLVTFMKPEEAATTHPEVLVALTRLLKARGASVIVGDSPGGLFNAAFVGRVYAAAGMKAVEEAGAELNRDYTERDIVFPEAKIAKSFTCTNWLTRADAIINVCKLKSHGMMSMSAAVKNMFGAIPGTTKPEYHFRYPSESDFANMLVDLNEYFRPKLCIADAVVGMEGNGPTAGSPRQIGAILASTSPYALDSVCAEIIGLKPENVPTLQVAAQRGLGPNTWSENELVGDMETLRVTDFLNIRNHYNLQFGKGLTGKLISLALSSKPVLKDGCVGCGVCARTCPAKAIDMSSGRPRIDRKKCIRCFCCQEFCPKGAMVVHRPIISRMLNGRHKVND